MGDTSGPLDSQQALSPSSALRFAEAAALAGVDVARIEALAEGGELLFEEGRAGRRDRRIVRLVELAEVFPHVLGRIPETREVDLPAAATPALGPDASPSQPDQGLRELEIPRAPAPDEGLAVGADRTALVGLIQDLEVRLDLAERERQASTASLMMAQRRVLDLELRQRRRPLAATGAAAALLLSIGAMVAVFQIPGLVAGASADEIRAMDEAARAAIADAARAREADAGRIEAALGNAAARLEEAAVQAREGRAVAEERVAAERARRDAERRELSAALGDLEARLAASEEREARRSTELEVARDSASRERMRFQERMETARRDADSARAALREERLASADDRARQERALAELTARIESSARALEEFEFPEPPVPEPRQEATAETEPPARLSLGGLLESLFGHTTRARK